MSNFSLFFFLENFLVNYYDPVNKIKIKSTKVERKNKQARKKTPQASASKQKNPENKRKNRQINKQPGKQKNNVKRYHNVENLKIEKRKGP